MYRLIRPFFFQMDPERVHKLVMHLLSTWPSAAGLMVRPFTSDTSLHQTYWDLQFPHPIGLAAGLDKDGIAVDGLLRTGFSFIEVGTVTPLAQPGNPRPRLFRLKKDTALINRMGFNNEGATVLKKNLLNSKRQGIVGVNFGKNKVTPNDEATLDYVKLVKELLDIADYIAINVSSPNTPGLRDLQTEDSLVPLVSAVIKERNTLWESMKHMASKPRPPVLVKISPDLSSEALSHLAPALIAAGVDGFIATNTTISRPPLASPHQDETGGLSGGPLRDLSTAVIKDLYRQTRGAVPIIGSGGILSAEDAYEKIRAGANLVQIYTGFIYHGPQLTKKIAQALPQLLRRDGFTHISEAIGVDV